MNKVVTSRFAAVALVVAATLAVVVVVVSAAGASRPGSVTRLTVSRATLHYVGRVDFAALGRAQATVPAPDAARATAKFHVLDPTVVQHRLPAGKLGVSRDIRVGPGQVPGESGFFGLSGPQQAAVNGGIDLEPPDQGLCAGNGKIGEAINSAIAFYDPAGHQLGGTVAAYAFFGQNASDFFSDPRCYFDSSTQRWFFTEFDTPFFSSTDPPTQFLAVSDSADPLGSYTIWSIPTADPNNPGCPCFGDFDQLGVDNNGIYITTDEFGLNSNAFNGVIMYAVSKQTIEQVASTGIPPTFFTYRMPVDNFGQPIYLSPSGSPPGARFAPNTEYFVETNENVQSDNQLEVYALNDTSLLAQPAAPPLFGYEVQSERYTFPPVATQKAGPIPLGRANQDPEGVIESDFDAVTQVTYTGGKLYAAADTATRGGDGVAWWEITPKLTDSGLRATVSKQGYVTVNGDNLLYPVIAVDRAGNGYMAFTLTGNDYYPSPAYVAFTPAGPSGAVHVAQAGAGPEDSFTCYAAFVGPNYGGCRWGDYSAGVAMGSNVYLATEAIPPTGRDYLTNWGTFVWGAPAP